MTTNPTGSIAIQIRQARDRIAESEARAKTLAERIERIGDEGVLARALADTLVIVTDFIAHQQTAVASLEALERDALDRYLEASLREELLGGPLTLEPKAEPAVETKTARPVRAKPRARGKRKPKSRGKAA